MTRPVLTRIDHVGIAVRDLDASLARYLRDFDLEVLGRESNEEQGVQEAMLRVADSATGSSCIQLLEPLRPDSPVGKFLERHGEGMHHIAYGVDDVAAAMTQLAAGGARLIDTTPRHGFGGSSIAFLHPASVGGVLTELVQAATR
jgi:methylmalonyl-CoA/ethylmalonyl-CoA epimerase